MGQGSYDFPCGEAPQFYGLVITTGSERLLVRGKRNGINVIGMISKCQYLFRTG